MRDLDAAMLVFAAIALIFCASNIYAAIDSADDIEDFKDSFSPDGAYGSSQLELDVMRYVETVRPYFYFNKSRIGQWYSIEDIKSGGGVCSHYTYWYKIMAMKDGYYAQSETFFVKNPIGHEYLRVWNSDLTSYCIIDQMDYWCIQLQGVNFNE